MGNAAEPCHVNLPTIMSTILIIKPYTWRISWRAFFKSLNLIALEIVFHSIWYFEKDLFSSHFPDRERCFDQIQSLYLNCRNAGLAHSPHGMRNAKNEKLENLGGKLSGNFGLGGLAARGVGCSGALSRRACRGRHHPACHSRPCRRLDERALWMGVAVMENAKEALSRPAKSL